MIRSLAPNSDDMYAQLQRRPIKMRTALWSRALASFLVRIGITPNQISIMSSVFALIGALCFSLSKNIPARDAILLIGAASCIQLRLLCNMLDGLMAVECGKSTKTGELFNEFPDRISDVVLFVAAGYAAGGTLGLVLGCVCAMLSLMTAYVRAFGSRFAKSQDYSGPMAKPQRMFALTVGALVCSAVLALNGNVTFVLPSSLPATSGMSIPMVVTLSIICLGTLITCLRRVSHLAKVMESEPC